MKIKHLTDIDIQQYVLENTGSEKTVVEHIASCDICRSKAENYQLLFDTIQRQAKPVFDFNLSELVLAQLSQTKPANSSDILTVFIAAFSGISSIFTVCYLYSGYFSNLFAGFSAIVFYLVVIAALSVSIFQGWELYSKYLRQMKTLNSF